MVDLDDQVWQSTSPASRLGAPLSSECHFDMVSYCADKLNTILLGRRQLRDQPILPTYQLLQLLEDAPISSAPAVKLPCYILRQYSKTGGCFGRGNVLEITGRGSTSGQRAHRIQFIATAASGA